MKQRLLIFSLVLALLMSIYPIQQPASISAQTDGSADEIATLAEQVHIQNIRTKNFTQWRGGSLGGDLADLQAAYGSVIPVGEQMRGWALREFYDEASYVGVDTIETQPALMNLWASWCGPCRFEFPLLAETNAQSDLNYDLWFVNTGDTSHSAAYRFLRDQPEDLTVFYDEGDQFARMIGLRVYPTTILMDTDGTIILAHWGILTPLVLEFINAVAANPTEGEFDNSTVAVGEVIATLEEVDVESAQSLVYGQQVAGEITDDDWQHNYRFEGEAGDEIVIDMPTSDEDLDTYLVVLGPDGERVAEVDDGPEPPNAYIELTLPTTGTYIIVATRFLEGEGFSEGAYSLILRENSEDTNENAILPNIPIAGNLTAAKRQDFYLFAGQAEQVVTFHLEHDLADEEYLNLQVRIGANERIIPFTPTENGLFEMEVTLPETTEYSIYVSRPSASQAGVINYTLIVETELLGDIDVQTDDATSSDEDSDEIDNSDSSDATDDTSEVETSAEDTATDAVDTSPAEDTELTYVYDTDVLNYGQATVGRITDEVDIQEYYFIGQEGDIITIRLSATSGDLDTEVYLIGPTGALFSANDDYGRDQDSVIYRFILPMGGEYTILATRFTTSGLGGEGDFELSLRLEDEIAVASTNSAGTTENTDNTNVTVASSTLVSGDEVTGTIDNSQFEVQYTFDGERGQILNIEMDTLNGDLDPYLAVYNSAGKQIAFNDDDIYSAGNRAYVQDITLLGNDTYTIIATRYAGEHGFTSGEYTLKFSLSE